MALSWSEFPKNQLRCATRRAGFTPRHCNRFTNAMKFAAAMQEASTVLASLDLATKNSTSFDVASLDSFLQSDEAARGFFVTLLTGDFLASDDPPPVLIKAINSASPSGLTVLVKNLVMSAATEVLHKRNNDEENAAGSQRVLTRTKNIFACTNSTALVERAQALLKTLQGESEEFSAFVNRVNYDEEQKAAAIKVLNQVLQTA
jgi:hypothetical protein